MKPRFPLQSSVTVSGVCTVSICMEYVQYIPFIYMHHSSTISMSNAKLMTNLDNFIFKILSNYHRVHLFEGKLFVTKSPIFESLFVKFPPSDAPDLLSSQFKDSRISFVEIQEKTEIRDPRVSSREISLARVSHIYRSFASPSSLPRARSFASLARIRCITTIF